MDALQFAYWLNGFAELSGGAPPTAEQWGSIKEHLALVFKKVTPPLAPPTRQTTLDEIMKEINRQSPAIPYRWTPPLTPECSAISKVSDSNAYAIC